MTALRRSATTASGSSNDEYLQESDPYAWVATQVEKAKTAGVPHALCVTIDPPLAAALLERNAISWNRKLSRRLTERYTDAMKRGEWALNGETVIVADSGKLNNGQHRLYASTQSGCSFRTLIVFGIAEGTRSTLDQGKRRSITDELYMAGYTTVANRASAATTVLGYLKKDLNILAHGGSTAAQVLGTLQDHPKLMDGYGIAARMTNAFKVSPGVMIGLYYLFAQRSPDAAEYFFNSLIYGAGTGGASDARSRLVAKLREHSMRRHRMARAELIAITIKAWNYWTRGESTGPLFWRAMGNPEPLPSIDEWGETQDILLQKALRK